MSQIQRKTILKFSLNQIDKQETKRINQMNNRLASIGSPSPPGSEPDRKSAVVSSSFCSRLRCCCSTCFGGSKNRPGETQFHSFNSISQCNLLMIFDKCLCTKCNYLSTFVKLVLNVHTSQVKMAETEIAIPEMESSFNAECYAMTPVQRQLNKFSKPIRISETDRNTLVQSDRAVKSFQIIASINSNTQQHNNNSRRSCNNRVQYTCTNLPFLRQRRVNNSPRSCAATSSPESGTTHTSGVTPKPPTTSGSAKTATATSNPNRAGPSSSSSRPRPT